MRRLLWMTILMLAGCGQVNEDLTNKMPYNSLVGQEFRTKVELMVYRHSRSRGLRVERPGSTFFGRTRSEINPPFPIKLPSEHVIMGFLPPSSEFKVVKIKDEGNTGMHFINTYVEIIKSPDSQWVGKVTHISSLATYDRQTNPVPEFNPEYMEELPRTP